MNPNKGNRITSMPTYVDLVGKEEFTRRLSEAELLLNSCKVCPRGCAIDRANGELGYCLSSNLPIVSSYGDHHGEEPLLSGSRGAGNIFFGNCNLRCIFCQNFEISQNWKEEKKHEVTLERLADIMLELQNRGCHNIGLVSPTHFSVQILKSIKLAAKQGLKLPIIYNSNGYDSVEMLKFFDGVIDIYLPDFKYGDNSIGKKLSDVNNYYNFAKEAIREMFRQVGDELVIRDNVLVRGLIIRHLVLPNKLAESELIFKFIAEELSPSIYVSFMSQYYPTNKAYSEILIDRPIRHSEYVHAVELMEKYGLRNGWIQELESHEYYRPNFSDDRKHPFNSD